MCLISLPEVWEVVAVEVPVVLGGWLFGVGCVCLWWVVELSVLPELAGGVGVVAVSSFGLVVLVVCRSWPLGGCCLFGDRIGGLIVVIKWDRLWFGDRWFCLLIVRRYRF